MSSSVNPCPVGQVEGKPYVDAGEAARRLGVTRRVVVEDVLAGCGVEEKTPAKLHTLTGTSLPAVSVSWNVRTWKASAWSSTASDSRREAT